jgi:hypothetical protein
MTLQECSDKIQEYTELSHKNFNEVVEETIKKYTEIDSKFHKLKYRTSAHYPLNLDNIYWTLDYNEIECSWEERWNYGGYDSGHFRIPIKWIDDPSQFKLWIQSKLEDIENIKKETESKRESKKDQLLKEKMRIEKELKNLC